MEIFDNLAAARGLITAWREDYNHCRPHSSLGYQPPVEFAARVLLPLRLRLRSSSTRETKRKQRYPNPFLHNRWHRKNQEELKGTRTFFLPGALGDGTMLPCLALLARLWVDMPIISSIAPMADCGCFSKPADFAAFEEIVAAAHQRVPLRILGYQAVEVFNGLHFQTQGWDERRCKSFFCEP